MDLSKLTDVELRAELEAMQFAQGSSVGRPFDGGEERLLLKIQAIKTELEKRDAPRP